MNKKKSLFRTQLREFVTQLMDERDELVVADIADEFIESHPDLVDREISGLVRRAVTSHLDELCSLDDRGGQISLLDGLPVGIKISDGVVKPRAKCNWDDLTAGRKERIDNIRNAQQRLMRYDAARDRLRPYMADNPDVLVEDVTYRLGREAS